MRSRRHRGDSSVERYLARRLWRATPPPRVVLAGLKAMAGK